MSDCSLLTASRSPIGPLASVRIKSGIKATSVLAMSWLSICTDAQMIETLGFAPFTSRCIAVKPADDVNRHISEFLPLDQNHGFRTAAQSLTTSADHQIHGKRSAFQGIRCRAQDSGRADDLHGKRTAPRGLDALAEDGPDATWPDFVNP